MRDDNIDNSHDFGSNCDTGNSCDMERRDHEPRLAERAEIVSQLDIHFSAWWAGFLQCAIETMKMFRRYGEDEGKLVALALAAKQVRGDDLAPPSSAATHRSGHGLSLSEVAVQTGTPLETTRRTLMRMVSEGHVQRTRDRYEIVRLDELVGLASRQAEGLALLMIRTPAIVPSEARAGVPRGATGIGVSAYWSAILRYCANLRRRITKGNHLGCLVAGMLQVEAQVRWHLLNLGKHFVSRAEFNEVAEAMPAPLLPIQQTAIIAGESMARTNAAVRHAVELGLGTIPERGIFRSSIAAARVPDDSQAYTRGVKEALAHLVLASLSATGVAPG